MDLSSIRHDYENSGLRRRDLVTDPIAQFRNWFDQVAATGIFEPNAVIVSTVDADGWPSGRTVLLRGVDDDGFVFHTNYHSSKGRAIEATGRAGLTFHWDQLRRQVRVAGSVSRLDPEASDAYWISRPRGSQLAARASAQSEVIADRGALEAAYEAEAARWNDRPVERPDHWGGYRVMPQMIEFWQGRANRLHDRFRYTLDGAGEWQLDRLAP